MAWRGRGALLQISVITPVFNGASTLGAAIESVRAQTFTDWELVVIDDGSTDGVGNLGRAFESERRVRFIRQAHGGLASARNRGIEAAAGELTAFLDADDLWPPGYLASMYCHIPNARGASGRWRSAAVIAAR